MGFQSTAFLFVCLFVSNDRLNSAGKLDGRSIVLFVCLFFVVVVVVVVCLFVCLFVERVNRLKGMSV